jgi:hypothetical protein
MLFFALLLFMCAVLFGMWRKFGPVQWIWLLFGTAVFMMIAWLLLIVLVIEPERRRPGPTEGSAGGSGIGPASEAVSPAPGRSRRSCV